MDCLGPEDQKESALKGKEEMMVRNIPITGYKTLRLE
jgi:hypothetical protein